MASQRTAFVKFDFGATCKECIALNPVWHALARETRGRGPTVSGGGTPRRAAVRYTGHS